MNIFLNYLYPGLIAISEPLAFIVIGFFIGSFRDSNKIIFDKKLIVYSDLLTFISKHPYRSTDISSDKQIVKNELISLLAPVRLLANKTLEDCAREYFDTMEEYISISRSNIEEIRKLGLIAEKIMSITMEMEQLMRNELGRNRIYSPDTIKEHTNGKITQQIEKIVGTSLSQEEVRKILGPDHAHITDEEIDKIREAVLQKVREDSRKKEEKLNTQID